MTTQLLQQRVLCALDAFPEKQAVPEDVARAVFPNGTTAQQKQSVWRALKRLLKIGLVTKKGCLYRSRGQWTEVDGRKLRCAQG